MTNTAPVFRAPEFLSVWRRKSHLASVVFVLAFAALTIAPSTAWAAGAARASKSAVVVKVATNSTFGQILLSADNAPLYIDTTPPCNKSCLAIWPPLLMPKGKKIPEGTSGLSTVKFGHKLQVTYLGNTLYTFTSDTGSTPTGNGVQGFAVATVGDPSAGGGVGGYYRAAAPTSSPRRNSVAMAIQ
jgi:predicted lipoprotein with Yx(FWY)xxD motif